MSHEVATSTTSTTVTMIRIMILSSSEAVAGRRQTRRLRLFSGALSMQPRVSRHVFPGDRACTQGLPDHLPQVGEPLDRGVRQGPLIPPDAHGHEPAAGGGSDYLPDRFPP